MRIALLTFAVPWDDRPTNGLYNVAQARALSERGARTEIFSIAPRLPAWVSTLSNAAARQYRRPRLYTVEGVTVHTVRAPAAYPNSIRQRIGPHAPHWLSAAFAQAVRAPLRRELAKFRPDAVIMHGLLPWADAAIQYAIPRDASLIAIEHSSDDVMRIRPGSRLHDFYRRRAAGLGSLLVVNSRMGNHLQQLDIPGVDEIINGVTIPTREPIIGPRTDGTFRVLTAGAYHHRKGHADLLRGFAMADLPNAVLRFVGRPPARLNAIINQLGIADRIELIDQLPQQALLNEMANADLFAMPSYNEAFGLVFMESLAAGTPVLLTSDSGAATHLQDRAHCWTVPPRDGPAVARALKAAFEAGRQTRANMGAAGMALVREVFTWQRNAEHVLQAIRRAPAQTEGRATKDVAA